MAIAKKTAAASGKATAAIIDFSNVKERGNFNPKNIEPGDYAAKITKVESQQSKAGDDMWVFTIELDDVPRASYPHYCVLTDNQYWKIKQIFGAAGIEVGKRKVKVDPNKIVGRSIGVGMEDDEYEGRVKSTIVDVFPPDEITSDDTAPEDDDLEEDEVEEEAPKPKRAKAKPAPVEEDDEDEELEEDEEEEEPEPAPKKRAAKKAAPRKKPAPVVEDDDEEDDDELEIDEL